MPGNSAGIAAVPLAAGGLDGAAALAGAKLPVLSSQPCRAPGAAGATTATAPPTPAGDPSSTGHVWITIWHQYGRDPIRILSQLSQPTASVLVTGGRVARVSGHVP